MKRWSCLVTAGVILAVLACSDETEPAPPEDQPQKENTVQLLLSNAWDPYYAPGGEQIVFVEAYHVTVYDLVTRRKKNITPDFGSAARAPMKPVWLEGDVVAFVRKEDGGSKYRLWTVPAAGGDIKRYDADVDADSSLAGDESGQYVYYTGAGDQLIYRLDLESGEALKITYGHITGFALYDAIQKPGANFVYYVERQVPFNPQPHSEYIKEIKSDGVGIARIVLNTDKPFLEGLTVSADDKYFIFPHRDGLFAYEHKAGTETWLTRAPDKWTDKDRNPRYAPDGTHFVFARANNIYICEAL
jgi:hypothetical protein